MRILLVADIHANWPALAAIHEPHDVCLCLGDLVDYGPDPLPCIQWVREHATWTVRGNHDHGVAQHVLPRGGQGYGYLARATRPLMWQLLGPAEEQFLARMPVSQMLTLDGHQIFLVHATPRDPLDEYLLDDPETWTHRVAGVKADLICVGHTHVQFDLQLGRTRVVNPGSVGQPRDGDPRCAYAIITDGHVELKRVDYPVEETIRQIEAAALPDEAKRLAIDALRTGGAALRNAPID